MVEPMVEPLVEPLELGISPGNEAAIIPDEAITIVERDHGYWGPR